MGLAAAVAVAMVFAARTVVVGRNVTGRRPPLERAVVTIDPRHARYVQPTEARAPVSLGRRTPVGALAGLYDAAGPLGVVIDYGSVLGAEKIVVVDARDGTRRTLVGGARGARENMAVTDARLSSSWLVWEEASQYDIELGGRARWRIFAAPILPAGGIGRVRTVDEGTVATRPRCEFAVSGARLAYVTNSVSAGRRVRIDGRLVVIDLASGRRTTPARLPVAFEDLSWSGTDVVLLRHELGAPKRLRVCVVGLDGTVRRQWRLPEGWELVGRPVVSGGRLAFAFTSQHEGRAEGALLTDASGAAQWRMPPGTAGPTFVGKWVVYTRSADQNAASSASSIGVQQRSGVLALDPATGREYELAGCDMSAGVWGAPSGIGPAGKEFLAARRPYELDPAGRASVILARFVLR